MGTLSCTIYDYGGYYLVLPNLTWFLVSTSQVSFGSSEVDFTNNSTNAVDYIWDYGDGTMTLLYSIGPHEFDIDDEEFSLLYMVYLNLDV